MNAKPRVDRGVTQAIRSCDRPGCYEQFLPRSPRQKFCSKECQRAMERVLERERRWREPGTVALDCFSTICPDPSVLFTSSQNQEATRWRYVRPARRPRTRACLLKGCEQPFHPQQALERYCSAACRENTREWSKWKAQQKYRATPAGKEKRKAQSRRYRERVRNRKEQTREAAEETARVISLNFFDYSCDRPGCYEPFLRTSRSPRQRFCSKACRRALERVWERERRWREARGV